MNKLTDIIKRYGKVNPSLLPMYNPQTAPRRKASNVADM